MKKKLFNIKNNGLPNVSAGKANDTQDFFNQIIRVFSSMFSFLNQKS